MPSRKSFRYILRYSIDPFHHADDRLEELVSHCKKSRIEEVMLFFLAEELSTGHPTRDELKPWVNLAVRIKQRLRREKIDVSLNPWCTLYHVPRGRRLRPGQDFTLMVGETGSVSPIAACPLCTHWQNYLCDLFAWMIREIQPVALWVEDDWRLHNHGDKLGYGGCFCRIHMERFSKMTGCPVSREEILSTILHPGKPHPWRKLWLDLCRDSILEPARKLRLIAHDAHPSTRLALMSSIPDVHSIEGRDWKLLQQTLGDKPSFMIRPHLPPYTEVTPLDCPPVITRQTLAALHGPRTIYPELENSPRCGAYSKSNAYSLWECFNSACFGSSGITINHFDMMGNGTTYDPTFAAPFAGAKPMLNALADLGLDDRQARGVQVLFSPRVAEFLQTDSPSQTLNSLDARSVIWGHALSILGVSHGYTTGIPSAKTRAATPVAVGGQTLRAFSDSDIRTLLKGPLLLDGISADILVERGFGAEIGVSKTQWVQQEDSAFAYEIFHESNEKIYGVADPRVTTSRCATRLLQMTPAPSALAPSTIHRCDRAPLFPGSILFSNKQGGKILTLAYPFDGRHQFFMGFFNSYRRIFLQNLLFSLAPKASLAAVEKHPMHLYRIQGRNGELFAAFNVRYDQRDSVTLRVQNPGYGNRWKLLQKNGSWKSIKPQTNKTDSTLTLTLPTRLDPLQGVFLLNAAQRL